MEDDDDNAVVESSTTTLSLSQRLPLPPRAPELLYASQASEKRLYWDRSHYDSPASQLLALQSSSTLYVGNLSFRTRAKHVYAHFSQIGTSLKPVIKAIHMGLDRLKKTPCGFCFVEYYERQHALECVANLSGTKLCGNIIRCELDAGFQPGRQYGRGVSGGQVRDDRRQPPKRPRETSTCNDNNTTTTTTSIMSSSTPLPPSKKFTPKEELQTDTAATTKTEPNDDNEYSGTTGTDGTTTNVKQEPADESDQPPTKRQRT